MADKPYVPVDTDRRDYALQTLELANTMMDEFVHLTRGENGPLTAYERQLMRTVQHIREGAHEMLLLAYIPRSAK